MLETPHKDTEHRRSHHHNKHQQATDEPHGLLFLFWRGLCNAEEVNKSARDSPKQAHFVPVISQNNLTGKMFVGESAVSS